MKICKIEKQFKYAFYNSKAGQKITLQKPQKKGIINTIDTPKIIAPPPNDNNDTESENQNTKTTKEKEVQKNNQTTSKKVTFTPKTSKEGEYSKETFKLLDDTPSLIKSVNWLQIALEQSSRLSFIKKEVIGKDDNFFVENAKGTSRYNRRLLAKRKSFHKTHGEKNYFRYIVTLTLPTQKEGQNIYSLWVDMRMSINSLVAYCNSYLSGVSQFTIECNEEGVPHAHGIIYCKKKTNATAEELLETQKKYQEKITSFAENLSTLGRVQIEQMRGEKWFTYMNKSLFNGLDKIAEKYNKTGKFSTQDKCFIMALYFCEKTKIRQFTGGNVRETCMTENQNTNTQNTDNVELTRDMIRANYRLQLALKNNDFSVQTLKDFVLWEEYEHPQQIVKYSLCLPDTEQETSEKQIIKEDEDFVFFSDIMNIIESESQNA